MGTIAIEQYRAAIGLHAFCINKIKVRCDIFLHTFILPNLFVIYNVILPNLLLCCGDIEINPGPNQGYLNIGHVNIHSICSKFDDPLEPGKKVSKFDLLSSHIAYYQYDIFGVSETWLDCDTDLDLHIEGYHAPIRRDFNRHQRGVLVYVSENIPARRRPDLEPNDGEMICVEVQINKKRIIVCNCYRVPYYDIIKFSSDLEFICDKVSELETLIVLGDMNARNSAFWDGDNTNTEGRALLASTTHLGLQELLHEPTRVVGDTASCIDLLFTNNHTMVSCVGTRDKIAEVCDHLPIFAQLSVSPKRPNAYKRLVWDYKRGDYTKLCQLILHAPWQSCYVPNDVDTTATKWCALLVECIEACIPHYEATIRPKDKPFMNSEIRGLMRQRDHYRKIAKQIGSIESVNQFKLYRNKVVSAIRKAKSKMELDLDNEIISINTTKKKWWYTCKNALGVSTKDANAPLLNKDGHMITDSKEKADLLNDFFASQAMLTVDASHTLGDLPTVNKCIDPLIIMPEEVYRVLENLDTSKATGPDGISNRVLKEVSVPLAQPLSELLNFCLSLGSFPQMWKIAQVVPIFKKGDSFLCNNYRPISLLPCISKVFERLLFNHIFDFLKTNSLLNLNQSGFIPGDSTINQLMCICNRIASEFEAGNEVIGVFLDLTKAFDRVWHTGLEYKLKAVGIQGQVFKLLTSYLKDRQQFVTICGQKSEKRTMKAGVPQGSVLGPLLFLIYINDITIKVRNQSFLFADDTSLFSNIGDGDADASVTSLNCDLKEIYAWAKTWLIDINPKKTVAMLFSIKRLPSRLSPILLGDQTIPLVPVHKHLGMFLTTTLNWKHHIEQTTSKCFKLLGTLKKFKYRWSRRALETCFKSFVRPILEYGCILYDSCSHSDIMRVESVQLEAARIVTGAKKGTSHSALYDELGWTTLADRRKMFKLIKISSVINGDASQNLVNIFNSYQRAQTYATRSVVHGDVIVPPGTNRVFVGSPIISSMRLWNSLEPQHRLRNTVLFKSLMKTHYRKPAPLFNPNCPRQLQVTFFQLRLGFSNLNDHLAKKGCIQNPRCPCGFHREDVNHYLLKCPLYDTPRESLHRDVNDISRNLKFDVSTLLYGSNMLSPEDNHAIFKLVYKFIIESQRFNLS